eukprot:g58787.t1
MDMSYDRSNFEARNFQQKIILEHLPLEYVLICTQLLVNNLLQVGSVLTEYSPPSLCITLYKFTNPPLTYGLEDLPSEHSDDPEYIPSAEATELEQEQEQGGGQGSDGDDEPLLNVDAGLVSEDDVPDEVSGEEEEEVATGVESEEEESLPRSKFKDSKEWTGENAVPRAIPSSPGLPKPNLKSKTPFPCRFSIYFTYLFRLSFGSP